MPGCLVLDVRLPGLSGLDLQRRMAEANLDIPIVFITAYGDIPMTVRAMKGGAVEFLTKPFRDQELLDAIQSGLERARSAHAQRAESEELHSRYRSLTSREREVMAYVAAGLLNKQIAGELGTSETTVKIHRHRVMEKMGADSLAGLVRMADRLSIPVPKSVAACTRGRLKASAVEARICHHGRSITHFNRGRRRFSQILARQSDPVGRVSSTQLCFG
jgi:FixJ family two-component response regulator